MKQKEPLRISVNSPCKEKWETMSEKEKGRFCENCKNVVIDFTQVTDTEIFKHLADNPKICGRFYKDQLNREISPLLYQQNKWKLLPGILASFLTLFSLKSFAGIKPKKYPDIFQSPISSKPYQTNNDTTRISGIVTDKQNKPLSGVDVYFEKKIMATTDESGLYSFYPDLRKKSRNYIIVFSYPNLQNQIKVYHHSEGSVNYSVRLSENRELIMGDIDYESWYYAINSKKLKFTTPIHNISDDNKVVLSSVASLMKFYANAEIEIVGASLDTAGINRVREWQNMIKLHLVEKEGISEYRIKSKIADYTPELKNVLLFKSYYE